MLFPTYPWNFENEEHPRSSFFFGEIPDNWRRYSKSSEWTWDLDLFPSLVWYFRQLKWLDEPQDYCISWLELCLDFQCSTHQWIKPSNEADLQDISAETQSRIFCAAAKRVGKICKCDIAPALREGERKGYKSAALTALNLGRSSGLPNRPCLLRPQAVHQILCTAALEGRTLKESHRRSFTPQFDHIPLPLWSNTRRRLVGKQTPESYVPPPTKKPQYSEPQSTCQKFCLVRRGAQRNQ